MSYVRGAEDESLHEKHHARVTRGILWEGLGRGKGKGKAKAHTGSEAADCGWRVVRDDVTFGVKGKGKIVVADGSYGGSKVRLHLPFSLTEQIAKKPSSVRHD